MQEKNKFLKVTGILMIIGAGQKHTAFGVINRLNRIDDFVVSGRALLV